MISPVDMFFEGGVFQWAVLPLGLLAIVIALFVPGVIGIAKWRVPASVSLLGIASVVLVGALGTLVGMQMAWKAVATAPADIQPTMMAMGASVALYTLILAVLLSIPAAIAACFSAAVPAVVAVGPEPRTDIRGLLSAGGGAFAAFIVAVIGVVLMVGVGSLQDIVLPLLTVVSVCAFVTPLTVIACARIAREDQLQQGRIAGSRFFVAICGALALVLVGEFFRLNGLAMDAELIATVSPEMVETRVALGGHLASASAWLGWLFALMPLTAGVCGSLHWVRRVDGRVGIGAVITLVSVAVVIVMIFIARSATIGEVAALS